MDERHLDKYRSEFECDEHWQLRKKFLAKHYDRFPEDELICLAQVFTNVEFLGCRYPKETMTLIAQLSEGIVESYRDKQKNRLSRTFVSATDAANTKVKRKSDQFQNPPSKRPQFQKATESDKTFLGPHNNFKIKIINDLARRKVRGPNANIVLFEQEGDETNPQNVLNRAANSFKIPIDWQYDCTRNGMIKCCVMWNNKVLSEAVSLSKKSCRDDASALAVKKLKESHYTIKILKNIVAPDGGGISKDQVTDETANSEKSLLKSDNMGMKLMKLMGYTGGGLGKESQGIVEPVNLQRHLTREGLGLKLGLYNAATFRKKCQDTLEDYLNTDMKNDLVFSPTFTNEERAVIHKLANQLGLKSHSYGPKTNRTLIISRKIDPLDLVSELLELGGSTEKYQLIEPTQNCY